MKFSNRREFIKSGAATGAGIAAAGLASQDTFSQEISKNIQLRYRKLGSTGYDVTEIGFGAMNMRDAELVEAAIDAGINYIDTAHGYMSGVNEEVVGKVMKTKRDKVFLVTKIKWSSPDNMPKMIETSLKRLQTDYVDLLLLHVLSSRKDVLREDLMKIFDNARKKGQTRFIGVSTHSNQAEVLNAATDSKFWEAVLTGYSFSSPPEVTKAIERARKAGLAIIVMKSLKRGEYKGKDMGDITPKQAALKWVLQNPNVDTIIPGMTSFEHIAEDVAVMGMKLTINDRRNLRRYSEALKGYYCYGVSGCNGCKDKCPKGVEICEINRCLGYAYGYGNIELAKENYLELSCSNRIDICTDCDECAVKCVNGLNLTENIKKARELFA